MIVKFIFLYYLIQHTQQNVSVNNVAFLVIDTFQCSCQTIPVLSVLEVKAIPFAYKVCRTQQVLIMSSHRVRSTFRGRWNILHLFERIPKEHSMFLLSLHSLLVNNNRFFTSRRLHLYGCNTWVVNAKTSSATNTKGIGSQIPDYESFGVGMLKVLLSSVMKNWLIPRSRVRWC